MANSRKGKGESAEKCSYPAIVPREERAAEMTEIKAENRRQKRSAQYTRRMETRLLLQREIRAAPFEAQSKQKAAGNPFADLSRPSFAWQLP